MRAGTLRVMAAAARTTTATAAGLTIYLTGFARADALASLHAWTVTSGSAAVSAHVVVEDHCFATGHAPRLLDELQGCLAGHFRLAHATVQLEPASHAGHEEGTHP